jgi:hypothetical protein
MNVYSIIKNQLPKELKNLTVEEKRQCIDYISKLDNEGHQLIFIIINSYNKEYKLEYQGNTITSKEKNIDIKFNLDSLQLKLQHILFKFASIHYNTMLEEINRNSIQKI